MALSIPVPTSSFWDAIPLAQSSIFELGEAMTVNRTAGGQILSSASGDQLWSGRVVFGLSTDAERRIAAAVLNALRRPGYPFLAYDRRRPFPAADPDGSLLGASSVTVLAASDADLSAISLQGLPAGYLLTPGDLLGYTLGSAPKIYYVHELAEGAVADGAGETPSFQISPFRPGEVPSGTPVTLIRPPMTAKYDPNSFDAGSSRSGGIETGRAFRFIQTLEY